jgi:hypothetical protein
LIYLPHEPLGSAGVLPASRDPKPELAGETPALPGTEPLDRISRRLTWVKEKGHMEIHAPTENFLKSSGLFKGVVSSLRLDSIRPSAFVGLRRDKQAERYNF